LLAAVRIKLLKSGSSRKGRLLAIAEICTQFRFIAPLLETQGILRLK